MRKTRAISLMFITGLVVFSITVWGQEKAADQKPEGDGFVRKVIPLQYALPNAVKSLFSAQDSKSPSPWGIIKVDDRMKVLTVAGTASQVEDVEEAVKKIDVPPVPSKNVEITAYILLAKRQRSEADDYPAALNEVVTELKKVLNYQGFRLMSSAIIRAQDGEPGSVMGAADTSVPPDNFELRFGRLTVVTREKQTVHLDNLNFVILTATDRRGLAAIMTDINMTEGQKVVVGKTAFGSPDNALVLVLTAKVMD